MSAVDTTTKFVESNQVIDLSELLKAILPPKTSATYSLDDIDQTLSGAILEIKSLQKSNNGEFDRVLSYPVQTRLRNLSNDIDKVLASVDSLQEDIHQARQQFKVVKDVCCSDRVVQERQEMLHLEEDLKLRLQKSKFVSILEFFDKFCNHLETSLETSRKLTASNSVNYLQCFDWANYHQVMFLLRACGQAMGDLEIFECLFQQCRDMFGVSFRQPTNKMDLNNFIEFHSSYSLETQVDIILNSHGDRCELNKYLEDSKLKQISSDSNEFKNRLFDNQKHKIVTITVDCCRLLVDLNIDYIEAYLTDGINIDKLNGMESSTFTKNPPVETLPSYAFSPQDYITQIGHHLLALKKQTGKFDHADDGPLIRALGYLGQVKNCTFEESACKSPTEVILKCVARQIIRSLVGRTSTSVLSQLNANGLKQISTDAAYLNDVLKDLNLLDDSDPYIDKFKSLLADTS